MPKKKTTVAGQRTVSARDGTTYAFRREVPDQLPHEVDFGEQLRTAIKNSGISQYHLSKVSGVPQGAISVFLNGGDLRLNTFNRLALLMGFDLVFRPSQGPSRQKPVGGG